MDNWNILLESRDDGLTVATVLDVPNLQTTDKTKQGAVEKVRQLLEKRYFQEIMAEIRAERENNWEI